MARAGQPQLSDKQLLVLAALCDGLMAGGLMGAALRAADHRAPCSAEDCQRPSTVVFVVGGAPIALCSRHAKLHVMATDPAVTPRELVDTIARMPLSPASQAALLRAALDGDRWSLLLVRMHAWRQRQMDRSPATLLGWLWRRFWR